jgi:hypothetical protein
VFRFPPFATAWAFTLRTLSDLKEPSLFSYITTPCSEKKSKAAYMTRRTICLSNSKLNFVCNMCSSALSTAKEQCDILMNMYRSCYGSEMIIHNKIAEKKTRQHSKPERATDTGYHLCNLIKLFSRGVVGRQGRRADLLEARCRASLEHQQTSTSGRYHDWC